MNAATIPGRSSVRGLAVALFVALPWLIVHALLLAPAVPAELDIKAAQLERRGRVDTLIAGDSRVMRIDADPFERHGWRAYNMGLSGMSPEDTALALRYAFDHAPVRRVVLGASFENMTQRFPWEFSNYRDLSGRDDELRRLAHLAAFPYELARPRLRLLLANLAGDPPPAPLLEDGRAAYVKVRQQIASGGYDLERGRDPRIYFARPDGARTYVESGTLSAHAMRAHRDTVAMMRRSGAVVLIFETGRTREFQALFDADPALHRLQEEWRGFYRSLREPCVGFLTVAELDDAYSDPDFFDAVHFLGRTEQRLGARLAGELDALEQRCRSAGPGEPR